MAVGQQGQVMVLTNGVVRHEVTPFQVAFPVEQFNDATCSARAEVGVASPPCAHEAPVVSQVRHHASIVIAGPALNHLTTIVNQVSVTGRRHGHERVTVEGGGRLQQDTHRVRLTEHKGDAAKAKEGEKEANHAVWVVNPNTEPRFQPFCCLGRKHALPG